MSEASSTLTHRHQSRNSAGDSRLRAAGYCAAVWQLNLPPHIHISLRAETGGSHFCEHLIAHFHWGYTTAGARLTVSKSFFHKNQFQIGNASFFIDGCFGSDLRYCCESTPSRILLS